MITQDVFLQGFFVLIFYLMPNLSADEPHISLSCKGNVHIDVQFSSALTGHGEFIKVQHPQIKTLPQARMILELISKFSNQCSKHYPQARRMSDCNDL
jgi:hypothetical protein